MTKFLLTALALFALAPAHAQVATEYEKIHALWSVANSAPPPKNFNDVIPKLLAYRKTSGGANWQVNYLLGVSYCFTPGDEAAGKAVLTRVLTGFQITTAALKATQQVLVSCGKTTAAASSTSFEIVPVSGVNEASITHGKSGYIVATTSNETVNPTQLSQISASDLQARLFPADRMADALVAADVRVKDYGIRGKAAEGFIIESKLYYYPAGIASCLAQYRSALKTQFGMEDPSSVITVYAVDPPQVPVFAAALHGVSLPLGTVAYSVVPDMSIVGVGNPDACGSLAHELTHLEIHQNFGDSPAWLEEGLASEVAVGYVQNGQLHFMSSWRDNELQRDWQLRPSVSKLLQLSWSDYSTTDSAAIHKVAATHAMAAVFIRYLDAKGKLIPIYMATRDTLSSPHPQSAEEIVTAAFGKDLTQIDDDFALWFQKK